MDDDWIFLGDGTGSGSDSDSASASGSDSDSGFTIVRRGRRGGDQCSVVVSDADAPAPPPVAVVAVPQPTPPGLSFKVVSYDEVFSASASSSSGDGGRRELMPGCNDEEATAGGGEAIVQGAGSDDAAGTGSTDDCAVTCKEGCEYSDQVGEHDGIGTASCVEEAASPPSVAVASAPTVNSPETTAPVLHGEAHSELASGMDQGGAEEEVVDDEDSESCGEDDDVDTENSSEEEEDDDDTDSSGEEDMDTSSSEDDNEDMGSSSEDEDEDEDSFSSSDEDTDSSSEDEDEHTFSSSDEEYTESFSEDESYLSEIYSDEDDDDDDEEEEEDAESSGEEEEEEGSESCVEVDYVESSDEESHDADNTGEEDGDLEVSVQEQLEEDDGAECSGEVDDVESTGEEEDKDDSEISGEEGEGNTECSGDEDDVENSGDEPEDPVSSGEEEDDDAESSGEEEEEEEDTDTVGSGEEESSHVVGVAENGKKDIFVPSATATTTACDANAEQAAATATANATGAVRSETFPSKNDDIDTDSSGSDMDTETSDSGSDMDTGSSDSGSDMDTESSDMEDDDCLESHEEGDIVDVAENDGNPAISAMLFPKAKASGANMQDYEEDGSLFDMLLPRDHAIGDDIDTDSSGLESDEEDGVVDVAENGNQDILAMLRATACHANIDDYEDESEHGSVEEELEDGEDEAATATAACGYSAEPSHGTRRPEFAARAARGYDDVDTDSDMEEGDVEVVAADDVNGTTLHGWRATTTGGVVESQQHWGFASQSQTERWWEDQRRQLAAEALASSGQQRSYADIDDTCDLPGTAATGGGPAGSCARTAEAQFTVRAEQRDTERALATEEVGRREAAQRELEDGSLFDMLFPRDCAIDDDIDSSDEEDEAANAAEALESSRQQQQQLRSYDDVDDTCDVPRTAAPAPAPGGGPAGSCAQTAEAQFTARAERDAEHALAMEEARRRETAQQELDRALASEAAAAAEALEWALLGCPTPTAKRQATVVTRPAVAEPAVRADITFIIGVYVLVYLVVSLVSSWLA